MGRSAQEKPKKFRATKAGLPLMSFANGRNFRLALRLIVFGVGSGESANRRLKLEFRVRGLGLGVATGLRAYGCIENLPAISRSQKPIGGDDQSQLLLVSFIR